MHQVGEWMEAYETYVQQQQAQQASLQTPEGLNAFRAGQASGYTDGYQAARVQQTPVLLLLAVGSETSAACCPCAACVQQTPLPCVRHQSITGPGLFGSPSLGALCSGCDLPTKGCFLMLNHTHHMPGHEQK
eukprot:1158967-Pelagomonas_calceolata.AAC.3